MAGGGVLRRRPRRRLSRHTGRSVGRAKGHGAGAARHPAGDADHRAGRASRPAAEAVDAAVLSSYTSPPPNRATALSTVTRAVDPHPIGAAGPHQIVPWLIHLRADHALLTR